MKIPIITATEELKKIPVTATTEGAGRTWKAVEQLSGQVQDIGLDIAEKQQNIKIAINTAKGGVDLEAFNIDTVNELRKTANPDTYYQEWANKFITKTTELIAQTKGPRARAAMELHLNEIGSRELRKQKDYANNLWIDTEKAKLGEILSNYATQGKYEEGIKLIEISKDIYTPTELLTLKNSFKTTVDKTRVDLADVQADKAIEKNAKQAYIDLADSNYLSNLLPKQRQDKVEKAWATAKVQENEEKQKIKEAEDLAIKKEDQEISDLYLAKNYSQVYARAQASKILPGYRKQHWGDSAEAAVARAEKPEKIDPNLEIIEEAFWGRLIAGGVKADTIRDYIITSGVERPIKDKWLDRVQTHTDKEINRASNRAYDYMKKEIVSPSGIAGVLAKVIPEETKSANYARAQNALDDWVENQRLLKKSITGNDILVKAEELVKTFRPKINQNSPIIQKKSQDLIKGLGELGEISKGKVTEVPPVKTKPKQIKYKNIEEVKNAYNRKELTYGEAEEILKRDFGVK